MKAQELPQSALGRPGSGSNRSTVVAEATYEFPPMLIDAQNELDQVRADLRTLFKKVPWSVEPMDAWETHENAWRPASRPAPPGWDPEDAAAIARLRARELELCTAGYARKLRQRHDSVGDVGGVMRRRCTEHGSGSIGGGLWMGC